MDYTKKAVGALDTAFEALNLDEDSNLSADGSTVMLIINLLIIAKSIVFALLQIASNDNNIADEIKKKN